MEELNDTEIMKSFDQLRGLGAAINVFVTDVEDFQKRVDFINKAMDAEFDKLNPQEKQEYSKSLQLPPAIIPETTPHHTRVAAEEVMVLKALEIVPTEKTRKDGKSELHHLCETMSIRGFKKYIVSHLSEIESARQEAISALKSAPNPAKLVLEAVGRFFLQGTKAYTKGSHMINSRKASVLMLELFLAVIGESEREIEIEKPVKQEADDNAIAWKKRLISEGGVPNACEIDARGLLLFIACFGIPKGFKNDDIRDLLRVGNSKEIGHLLKGSRFLGPKIPDIVEKMKKSGMHVEAVDIVYYFGIEEKFSPQKILYSFLRESEDAWKTKRDGPIALKKEANEKHLAALQSVIKCLEDKKIDPAKLLPDWQIKDKMVKLEKDISDLNRRMMENKMTPKRKAGEFVSNKWNSPEMKRGRFAAYGSTPNGSSLMTSSHDLRLHDPRAAYYADGKSSYDGFTPHFSDGSICGYTNNHPSLAAAAHLYNTGPLPDAIGSIAGGRSSVNAVGVEVSMSPGLVTFPTGSSTGVHREMSVDKFGRMVHANGASYGWQIAGDAPYSSYTGQPGDTKMDGLYRPSPSMERFAGVVDPSSVGGGGNQNPSSSNLYSFADTVI